MASEVDYLAVVAHDFKEPVSDLRQLGLLLDGERDGATIDHIAGAITHSSENLLTRIDDLMKVLRLEHGIFAMEPVSVRGVCEDVYRSLRPSFQREGRDLNLKYHNRARLAVASPELLRRIVCNFCTNALHYSDSGTASELSIVDDKGHIRIAVRDFGPALPVEIWRMLKNGTMERPAPIAMRPGSSGIGLYAASQFARHMHAGFGAVRHHDGTSFYVDLAVSKQASLFHV